MGFIGDLFNEMLNDNGVSVPFGTRFKKSDRAFVQFYEKVSYDFGLTPSFRVQENERVPVTLTVGFDNKPYAFEIQGSPLHPERFLGRGGIFDGISRDIHASRNRVWAFDITRLSEGILTGEAAFPGDEALLRSEEALKILRLVGGGVGKPLSKVPAVHLDFAYAWHHFRIPDRIHFVVDSMYPFTDSDMLRIVNLITHNYRNHNAPVKFAYSGNPATGTMEIVTQENVPEPAQPAPAPHVPSPPQHAPSSKLEDDKAAAHPSFADFLSNLNTFVENAGGTGNPSQEKTTTPEDTFPYDFYRGLGLIDNEDMVAVPSVLGPIRVPMTTDGVKEYLLSYKPET